MAVLNAGFGKSTVFSPEFADSTDLIADLAGKILSMLTLLI